MREEEVGQGEAMKIVGICGSPRKNGNTEYLLRKVLEGAKSKGVDTEIILLADKKIEFCDGCLSCDSTGKCKINDAMQEIYPKIEKADILIIASPVHYYTMSGMTKNLIDRLNPFCKNEKIKGKKVMIIVTGELKEKWVGEKAIKDISTSFTEGYQTKIISSFRTSGNSEDFKGKVDNELLKLGKKLVSA